jgi:hypothetical protein
MAALIILSLVTLNRNANAEWEVTLGVREMTSILVALALLPTLLSFFRGYEKGAIRLPGVEFSWDRKAEIDGQIAKTQEEHTKASEVAMNPEKDLESVERIKQNADDQLLSAIEPEELPIAQTVYLQELHRLVRDFNRNQHQYLLSGESTRIEVDEIASRMRSVAPLLFSRIDVAAWLNSSNPGKRLAAIKYLDWAQDIEFLEDLVNGLLQENPVVQSHIWLTLFSMMDQLSIEHRELMETKLENYRPVSGSGRLYWKRLILDYLSKLGRRGS